MDAADDVFVESYDNETGKVVLNRNLTFYHWGAPKSTKQDFTADIRGEAMILTRNVRIRGQNIEGWGGQIVTSDTVEINALGEMAIREGSTILDSVEIYNCS
jgi:hypothetical protein